MRLLHFCILVIVLIIAYSYASPNGNRIKEPQKNRKTIDQNRKTNNRSKIGKRVRPPGRSVAVGSKSKKSRHVPSKSLKCNPLTKGCASPKSAKPGTKKPKQNNQSKPAGILVKKSSLAKGATKYILKNKKCVQAAKNAREGLTKAACEKKIKKSANDAANKPKNNKRNTSTTKANAAKPKDASTVKPKVKRSDPGAKTKLIYSDDKGKCVNTRPKTGETVEYKTKALCDNAQKKTAHVIGSKGECEKLTGKRKRGQIKYDSEDKCRRAVQAKAKVAKKQQKSGTEAASFKNDKIVLMQPGGQCLVAKKKSEVARKPANCDKEKKGRHLLFSGNTCRLRQKSRSVGRALDASICTPKGHVTVYKLKVSGKSKSCVADIITPQAKMAAAKSKKIGKKNKRSLVSPYFTTIRDCQKKHGIVVKKLKDGEETTEEVTDEGEEGDEDGDEGGDGDGDGDEEGEDTSGEDDYTEPEDTGDAPVDEPDPPVTTRKPSRNVTPETLTHNPERQTEKPDPEILRFEDCCKISSGTFKGKFLHVQTFLNKVDGLDLTKFMQHFDLGRLSRTLMTGYNGIKETGISLNDISSILRPSAEDFMHMENYGPNITPSRALVARFAQYVRADPCTIMDQYHFGNDKFMRSVVSDVCRKVRG